MRLYVVAVLAVVGLTGWQWQGAGRISGEVRPVQSAYENAINRYQGGESLRRASSPRQALPLADAGDMTGVDNARMADGGANSSGTEPSYRAAEGANASGVDNARFT